MDSSSPTILSESPSSSRILCYWTLCSCIIFALIFSELSPFGRGRQELAAPDIVRCSKSFPLRLGHDDVRCLHVGKFALPFSLLIDPTIGPGLGNISRVSAIALIPPACCSGILAHLIMMHSSSSTHGHGVCFVHRMTVAILLQDDP